jgi:hypothetical protein
MVRNQRTTAPHFLTVRWVFRCGVALGVLAIASGIATALQNMVATDQVGERASVAETIGSASAFGFVVCGLILFVFAMIQSRRDMYQLSAMNRRAVFWGLVSTSFVGGYLYFLLRSRLARHGSAIS